MKNELPKIYEPQKVENDTYRRWEESGCFNPDNSDSDDTYCNVLPPPNANGELHLGHASGYTVMDIFGRYSRMNGKKTLLLPGKDHAGIQTQVVFEKILETEQGVSRYDLGRDEFYKKTYDFCMDRADYMRSQEKRIGIGADWSREKFTLDPDVLKIALETFVRMHDDGLIYKGKRIINWCPRCATALADIEVLHKETPGKLYYIKYPIEKSDDFITVATTRPETMLGDSAVAVNPADERFASLVGKNVILPLQNRSIPIIADKRIDAGFGTGAVKITPSHDPLDWEIGKDHGLAELDVIDEQATITALGGEYAGMTTRQARERIIADLEKSALLDKTEELTHSVSICERCKTVIEPLTSSQWFIDVDADNYSLKRKAIEAVQNGSISVYPENFKKILIDWFEGLRDWCISRQIWWGPRFPVWYCEECGPDKYVVSLEKPTKCPTCASKKLSQDENTFDTWFTSGQWVHTTLRSHENDFENFYPSDMMVMGRDLLFFWASRMIMMSLYCTGRVPFENLFFTGLIRDKEGQKMSKSKGNGIDPLLMIDKFGADALRMSIIMDTAPGQDSRLYEEKIETFRNFANKLWNISRYCLSQEGFRLEESVYPEDMKSAADSWIIDGLNKTIKEVTDLFEKKQISLAANSLKSFTWDAFADWYVEANKIEKNQKILGYVLEKILRLWHPFMPFITEHIWTLAGKNELLAVSRWPRIDSSDVSREAQADGFVLIQDMIKAIRNARLENDIEPGKKISVTIDTKSHLEAAEESELQHFISNHLQLIQKLRTGVENISIVSAGEKMEKAIQRTVGGINIYILLEGLVDTDKEKAKVEKEIANLEKFVSSLEGRLANADFVAKAPGHVIEAQRKSLSGAKTDLAELKKRLTSFE